MYANKNEKKLAIFKADMRIQLCFLKPDIKEICEKYKTTFFLLNVLFWKIFMKNVN
jgi:hypothetical protein